MVEGIAVMGSISLTDEHVKKKYPLFFYVSSYFRNKRVKYFIDVMKVSGSERLLDVGGEYYFWKPLESIKDVTLLNLHKTEEDERIKSVKYDGGRLPFGDNSFDIVFSNSTIEHVGDFKQQELFAHEIGRVAKRHFIQTPSYWFAYEPHAQIPFFQFLTDNLKIVVAKYFNKSTYTIDELLSIRLLKKSEIRVLFPQSKIVTERFFLLPKSYYIIKTER